MSFPEGLSDKSRWTLKYGLDETRDHFKLSPDELDLGMLLKLLIEIYSKPVPTLSHNSKFKVNLNPHKFHRFNQPVVEHESAGAFASAMGEKTPEKYFQVPERFVQAEKPQFSFLDPDDRIHELILDPSQVDRFIEGYIVVQETAKKRGIPKTFGHVQRLDENITKYFVPEQDDDPELQEHNYSNTINDWHRDSIAMYSKDPVGVNLYQFNYTSGEVAIGLSSANIHSVILADRSNAQIIAQPFRDVAPQIPFKSENVS